MTKYLIIALLGLILITVIVLISSSNKKQPPPLSSPKPTASLTTRSTIPNPSIPLATPIPSEDITDYQSKADKLYADETKQQTEEYPWLQQLPLQTSDYFVYFEISNNTFTAEIYNSSKQDQLKEEILERLKRLNIDISKYTIKWQVK